MQICCIAQIERSISWRHFRSVIRKKGAGNDERENDDECEILVVVRIPLLWASIRACRLILIKLVDFHTTTESARRNTRTSSKFQEKETFENKNYVAKFLLYAYIFFFSR